MRFFLFLVPIFCFAKPSILSLGIGAFDFHRDRYRTTEFRVEYKSCLEYATIRPMIGAMGTIEKSFYLYGGFGLDWILKEHLLISPNFAAGYYNKGEGKNLHFPLEFRSGIELGWVFCNQYRIGIHFYHISNASLGHKNPGEESLVLFFSIPIGK